MASLFRCNGRKVTGDVIRINLANVTHVRH